MNKIKIKALFNSYKIWNKQPDAIIIDKECWDHKVIFYQQPKFLDKYANHDIKRRKGEYYNKKLDDGSY